MLTALDPSSARLPVVTRPGGTPYLSVPRAPSFDDRLYRFAGYFAKYALGKFGKRIEHQQRFDLEAVLARFEARGFEVESLARVPAGFSWMNDPRTEPLQGAFTDELGAVHRGTGNDAAGGAEFGVSVTEVG